MLNFEKLIAPPLVNLVVSSKDVCVSVCVWGGGVILLEGCMTPKANSLKPAKTFKTLFVYLLRSTMTYSQRYIIL